MKLKQNSSKQKLRGAYYTPLPLAMKMIELFKDNPDIKKILEPSCGDGVFIDGLQQEGYLTGQREVVAIEIDKGEASQLKSKYKENKNIKVYQKDFFDYYAANYESQKFDLILGNPPYIRYQYLEEAQREIMSDILVSHGMKSNKLVNAWVGFLVACVQMLNENGKIAFVIPAEILQVAYAEDLRLFLADNLTKITLITFEKLIFPDIEQEVIVLIGEKSQISSNEIESSKIQSKEIQSIEIGPKKSGQKKSGPKESRPKESRSEDTELKETDVNDVESGIKIIELGDLDDLETLNLNSIEFQKLQHVHEKWTKYFTKVEENALISKVKADPRFQSMSDIALINVGITTGNNKYFSIDKETVAKYKMEQVTRPLIGRSSHVAGIYYTKKDWDNNIDLGKAAYLIDFPNIPYEEYPAVHKKYIKEGEKKKENKGYKCSIRERWYRIPSIWVPDAFFLRRNNLYPKFVLNQCDAVSTDTMHRIKFNDGIEPERILLSYYNSISLAFTEICGRSYGGGVLEILPGEVGNIVLPRIDKMDITKIRELLDQIDKIIRSGEDVEAALDLVDEEILVKELKLDHKVCVEFRNIWNKLRKRRLGRGL